MLGMYAIFKCNCDLNTRSSEANKRTLLKCIYTVFQFQDVFITFIYT